jgi:hypothetical protein
LGNMTAGAFWEWPERDEEEMRLVRKNAWGRMSGIVQNRGNDQWQRFRPCFRDLC